MCLSYHSEVKLKEVYTAGFESDVEDRMMEVVGWLKKEYRRITGNSVNLTKEGEVDMRVENSSRVRSWVIAQLSFRVGGLTEEMNNKTGSKALDENWRSFVEQGGWDGKGGKRPSNDSRKKEQNS